MLLARHSSLRISQHSSMLSSQHRIQSNLTCCDPCDSFFHIAISRNLPLAFVLAQPYFLILRSLPWSCDFCVCALTRLFSSVCHLCNFFLLGACRAQPSFRRALHGFLAPQGKSSASMSTYVRSVRFLELVFTSLYMRTPHHIIPPQSNQTFRLIR